MGFLVHGNLEVLMAIMGLIPGHLVVNFLQHRHQPLEIWDALTLDKHSSLQPAKPIPKDLEPIGHSPNALAYSPDGHSLAGCFGATVTIWDIQTGGVIKEIECEVIGTSPKSLVWSLDGTAIGIVFPAGVEDWIVVTCDIASAKVLFHTSQSPCEPCLCPYNNSIRMMTMSGDKTTINTFEIWPVNSVYPVKSYSVNCDISSVPTQAVIHQDGLLSGNSYDGVLYIYNIHNQLLMLHEFGSFTANCLSPGRDLLAAVTGHEVWIWKFDEDDQSYYSRGKLLLWEALRDTPRGLKFSPTSPSLLISRDSCLEVQPLRGSTIHTPEKPIFLEFSANGTYLVTAFREKSTVTITNLYNSHSQFIAINFAICQLTLTGNVLLVHGSPVHFAAWRLTAEGTVDGASYVRWVGYNSSHLLTKVQTENPIRLWASSQIGIVNIVHHNIETGEELESVSPCIPLSPLPSWEDFYNDPKEIDFSTWPSFNYYNLVEYNGHPSKDNLPACTPWCQEGWLMYPEGEYQHRLWLPTHWRTKWEEAHWLNDIKMLRLVLASGKAIIKL